MTQSIWSKLFTALRGGASEVGESIVDQQALRILDQEIRDADSALANAKRELVSIMAKHKLAADRVGEYDAKIKDLESKAMAAIQANREDLALEVAEAISTLTNERDVEQKQTAEFGGYAESMRKDITKAESRIKSLRQQVDMAKARDSVQKAQVSASIASGGANGKLETAVGTLNRLQAKQQQRAAELQAQDELAEASTGTDLERKLRDAGITPNEGSANAILERLKQKSAEYQIRTFKHCHSGSALLLYVEVRVNALNGFKTIAGLALFMVALQLLNVATGYSLMSFGLIPRTVQGLFGILTSPFLHASFAHLSANLIAFLVLGSLVMIEGVNRFITVSSIVSLLGGLLVWLFGCSGVHVGTSGWVFGLWAYLLSRAWFHRSWGNLLTAAVVALLYGGLVVGFLPRQGVSFEGHLFGALAGFIAAKVLLSTPRSGFNAG